MRKQEASKKDSAAGLIPKIRSGMPWRVSQVKALPNFRLRVRFLDGLKGTVDMSAMVHSPDAGVFRVLADPALFKQVFVDLGAVTWPGELDLAPDAMYAEIKKNGEWKLL